MLLVELLDCRNHLLVSRLLTYMVMPIWRLQLLDISYGVECIVPIAAYAEPSGIVDDDANFICKKICAAVKNGCDAILLDLHGAILRAMTIFYAGLLLLRYQLGCIRLSSNFNHGRKL